MSDSQYSPSSQSTPAVKLVIQQVPKDYHDLVKTSWILIILTCGAGLIPILGIMSWFIAVPVFVATFIMAIITMSRGGTLPGILLLISSIFLGPIFVACAPFILGVFAFLGISSMDVNDVTAAQEHADASMNASVTETNSSLPPTVVYTPPPMVSLQKEGVPEQSSIVASEGGAKQNSVPLAALTAMAASTVMKENDVPKTSTEHFKLTESEAVIEFNRGKAFSRGDNVAQDLVEAVRCYMRAANSGYAPAQHQLGVAYAKGWGVPQSDEEAVIWYRKAAIQGFAEAQHDLAVRCILGQGTNKNIEEGKDWYRKAAAQGWEESITALKRFESAPNSPPMSAIVIGIAADDYLNVRSAPAMNSNDLFKLTNGQTVQIRGDSVFNGDTEWIPISVGTQQGWVRKKYLQLP
ncbi:MAG: SH3 domain-containing protein [Verrucomicrobiaceae bacterium]